MSTAMYQPAAEGSSHPYPSALLTPILSGSDSASSSSSTSSPDDAAKGTVVLKKPLGHSPEISSSPDQVSFSGVRVITGIHRHMHLDPSYPFPMVSSTKDVIIGGSRLDLSRDAMSLVSSTRPTVFSADSSASADTSESSPIFLGTPYAETSASSPFEYPFPSPPLPSPSPLTHASHTLSNTPPVTSPSPLGRFPVLLKTYSTPSPVASSSRRPSIPRAKRSSLRLDDFPVPPTLRKSKDRSKGALSLSSIDIGSEMDARYRRKDSADSIASSSSASTSLASASEESDKDSAFDTSPEPLWREKVLDVIPQSRPVLSDLGPYSRPEPQNDECATMTLATASASSEDSPSPLHLNTRTEVAEAGCDVLPTNNQLNVEDHKGLEKANPANAAKDSVAQPPPFKSSNSDDTVIVADAPTPSRPRFLNHTNSSPGKLETTLSDNPQDSLSPSTPERFEEHSRPPSSVTSSLFDPSSSTASFSSVSSLSQDSPESGSSSISLLPPEQLVHDPESSLSDPHLPYRPPFLHPSLPSYFTRPRRSLDPLTQAFTLMASTHNSSHGGLLGPFAMPSPRAHDHDIGFESAENDVEGAEESAREDRPTSPPLLDIFDSPLYRHARKRVGMLGTLDEAPPVVPVFRKRSRSVPPRRSRADGSGVELVDRERSGSRTPLGELRMGDPGSSRLSRGLYDEC